jgi:hypothetical protein
MLIEQNIKEKSVYALKCLPDRYWRLGPLAWLFDHYLTLQSNSEGWIDGGRAILDKAVAEQLGTTEDIIEDWRWFLLHEGLIRQRKATGGGWLVALNPNYEPILDDWMAAWRKLRYQREALWW